jgi:hypothetical protein
LRGRCQLAVTVIVSFFVNIWLSTEALWTDFIVYSALWIWFVAGFFTHKLEELDREKNETKQGRPGARVTR